MLPNDSCRCCESGTGALDLINSGTRDIEVEGGGFDEDNGFEGLGFEFELVKGTDDKLVDGSQECEWLFRIISFWGNMFNFSSSSSSDLV